jgi:hypothetical protein
MAIHADVATTVDRMLRGIPPRPEMRERAADGKIEVVQLPDEPGGGEGWGGSSAPNGRAEPTRAPSSSKRLESALQRTAVASPALRYEPELVETTRSAPPTRPGSATVRIYPYGVSRSRLEKAVRELKVPAVITKTWDDANAIVALKAHYRREPAKLKDAISSNKPTFVVKSNTQVQIDSVIRDMFGLTAQVDEAKAMQEAEEAIERVIESGETVELNPQNAYIRRMQHQLAEQYQLASSSVGAEPRRRVRIAKR